ncbi:hypothetical protein P691DRAFT_213253 [Macrolepiota fuliginosa MF-IS2]|uniref:Uncharacterized protein n=1 Tax=Macrolepiota fuliginosa MF-IS2 TaxID=1400762 RepID=A0A9P6C081_9AGAR|nr:hypothetical protein P691DRAFT_213253 [Macrolepiota fuliginosa MF-IS2]
MPLPDERPRQSVANLIGRFENQTKRQPAAPASRSSSVVSHTTGDSAKEEVKEKREWPPKSVTEAATTPIAPPPSSFRFKSPVTQPEPLPATTEPPAPAEPTTNGAVEPKLEVPEVPAEPAPAQPELVVPTVETTSAPSKPTSSKTRTPPKPATTTSRAAPPIAHKTAPRASSATRTPPAKSATTSVPSPPTQPLKPQHTGQSTTSATAKKTAAKAIPTTPARPKTPARTGLTPSRSSNLYAPTAASLARARNAPPSAPTPAKKTPSTSASERLSKPTAASLSRARTPAPGPSTKATTPVKTTATPRTSLRGAPARTTDRGDKVPATPSKTKKAAEASSPKQSQEDFGEAVASTILIAEADVFSSGVTPETKPAESISSPVPEIEPEAVEDDRADDSTVVDSEVKVVVLDEDGATQDESITSPPPEPQAEHEPDYDEGLDGSVSTSEDPAHEETEERDVDPIADKLAALASQHDGTDIEQIVNLLETGPTTRAGSDSISTPSDIQEIPDEEH